jgi:hypothetical protein
MGKILLLDISIVVFALGGGPGEVQVFILGIPIELIVDEGVVVI